jgi:flagellar basal-body rod protein FlgB
MMKLLAPFDSNIQLLAKVLDLRAQNQQVIGSNIANAETPGYAPAKFQFEGELREAIQKKNTMPLATPQPGHFPLGSQDVQSINGSIIRTPDRTGIGDENGVNVDDEMLAMSENELMYETSAQLLQKKLGLIRYVITGGQ